MSGDETMPGSWEQLPFLQVSTLTREVVHIRWASMLRELQLPPRSFITYSAGQPFDSGRNGLVKGGLSQGCEWIFFLDDDVLVPGDCIARLMSHGKPIVSGLYWRRSPPLAPVAMRIGKDTPAWIDNPAPNAGLQRVDYVGAGCLLLHRTVFDKVPQPWFDWLADREDLPPTQRLSEDFAFCQKAKAAGYELWLDPAVRCGHVGYSVSTEGGLSPAN